MPGPRKYYYKADGEDEYAWRDAPKCANMKKIPYATPLVSMANSVHSSQVGEVRQAVSAAGLTGVHYDDKGVCRYEGRDQRRKHNALLGLHDKDGCYGDG